jgi:hypothetical protein
MPGDDKPDAPTPRHWPPPQTHDYETDRYCQAEEIWPSGLTPGIPREAFSRPPSPETWKQGLRRRQIQHADEANRIEEILDHARKGWTQQEQQQHHNLQNPAPPSSAAGLRITTPELPVQNDSDEGSRRYISDDSLSDSRKEYNEGVRKWKGSHSSELNEQDKGHGGGNFW